MIRSQKAVFVTAGIALIITVFVIGFVLGKQVKSPSEERSELPGDVVCTLEARVCPDGTAVGRQGSDCSFAACPGDAPDQKL